jgi:hypothetical protein
VSDQDVYDALPEIQNLFLVGAPQSVEGEERFSVNSNTRTLILDVFGRERPDTLRRFMASNRAMTGQQDIRGRGDIADTIRQVRALLYQDHYQQAEQLVHSVLTRYPNHPDLIGELGVIYSRWQPARWPDARQQFERAAELQCRQDWMYGIWAEMELRLTEWGFAAVAAEKGIKRVGERARLCYLAGYAYSRLGQDYQRAFNAMAEQTLMKSQDWLKKALKDPTEGPSYIDRDLNSRVFRALATNTGVLTLVLEPQVPDVPERIIASLREELLALVDRWEREYPQDRYVAEQARWIRDKYAGVTAISRSTS